MARVTLTELQTEALQGLVENAISDRGLVLTLDQEEGATEVQVAMRTPGRKDANLAFAISDNGGLRTIEAGGEA